ncbi:2-oxo acid dehydrogenase subunit E2 [Baekduia soli]|uniref:Dihydrolipoamide acetyltransferase component of pyruvate dehydrogenase complex n=1 Tax=Baekduia soli TaxID=496014 RepID=A0A5B8U997_9ACTN|nr:dihydrolipoamide acetyltransferase family protein [Baekduia soli]QEC49729.1 2-oxo acid dehydrogenase subunit E2 [Baekduia soli]
MSSSPTETLVDVLLPAMGTSITEGTLVGWRVRVGDAVAADDPICDVSTDKVDTECPSPAAGRVAELLVAEGETVEVGTVIARLAVPGGGEQAPSPAPASAPVRPAANGNGHAAPRLSPVVARIVAEHAIDPSVVRGTGRGGRITKRDVMAHLEVAPEAERPLHSESPYRPDPPPAAPAAPDDLGGVPEPLSRLRRTIGAAMRRSLETAATCHTIVECDLTRVESRRRALGLTALPLIARATSATLRAFPDLNATLQGDTITRYARVHLGIAVALGDDGLIVPVIHDAQDLSPEGLGARIKDLARRARARELAPDEVRGATFTITNPGAFGAIAATPIIDVPQVAILDVEAVVRRPVVVRDAGGAEAIAIRSMVNFVLGWDHRAVDGAYAARFLSAVAARLQGDDDG